MLPAVLASLAYRCSQVECSGWLSTIDARFNANLNGVYALQAGSSPFPGHTLENVVNQGQIKTLFLYPIDDPDYGKLWCIGDSDGSLNVKAYIIADGRESSSVFTGSVSLSRRNPCVLQLAQVPGSLSSEAAGSP